MTTRLEFDMNDEQDRYDYDEMYHARARGVPLANSKRFRFWAFPRAGARGVVNWSLV